MTDIKKYGHSFLIERRFPDGSMERFTVSGLSRYSSSAGSNGNGPSGNCGLYIFSAEIEIKPGDMVLHGNRRYELVKVDMLNDISGKLYAYRAESV